ncbi:MAG TPA: 50S ribosomal protein L18 [Nitrosopumilaceae archaeon]|nr:50S ribosomal protein L18 [Nitrosopumilaceae archaeon]
MVYSQILRRLREEKTNYRKRKHLLMGRRDYITVQISSENTLVQIHKPEMQGDKVLASAHSRYLLGKGWKGSRKNIPAAYLTGYLAGKKALGKGVKAAVLYSGTRKYTQRMAAALKGVIDAGLEVPADSETFPNEERISGKHLKVQNEINKVKSAIDGEIKTK